MGKNVVLSYLNIYCLYEIRLQKMSIDDLKKESILKLDKALESLNKDLSSLRVGRASADMLNTIKVDYYGSFVPIEQVGNITIPEPRMIVINLWDKSSIIPLETALRSSNLGINPIVDGTKIKLPIPPLTEERRKELAKKASEYAEKSKIAIRQIRKIFLDDVKDLQKNKLISEDELKTASDSFEKTIKNYITDVDNIVSLKAKDIMSL